MIILKRGGNAFKYKGQKQSEISYLIASYKTIEEKPFLKRTIYFFLFKYQIYSGGSIMSYFDLLPESLLRLGNSDKMLSLL